MEKNEIYELLDGIVECADKVSKLGKLLKEFVPQLTDSLPTAPIEAKAVETTETKPASEKKKAQAKKTTAKLLQSSPAEYVKYPKLSSARAETNRTVISVEDFNRMLDRFEKGNPFRYALLIGFYTGLRIGEVYALTWDDIDLKEGIIDVNKLVYKRNYGVDVRQVMKQKNKREEKSAWYFGDTKTAASVRKIKIGATLINELKEYKKMQLENQMMYGEYYTQIFKKEEKDEKGNTIYRLIEVEKSIPVTLPHANLIMRKENGQYSSTDSFKYAARIIHYDLAIKFNFHSLRHTHATKMIESGVSPKAVQERLGHENIETTLQTYVHNTEAMEQDAVDVFEKAVNSDVVHR